MKFEILDHTSDLKIKITAPKKEDIFFLAMKGMFEGARYEFEKKEKNKKVKIKIKSFDFHSLLVDFLNEVLYLTETKKLVFQKMLPKKITDNELEAILIGKKLKRMGIHIKGVTYYGLDVSQNKEGKWEATILFDI